MNFNPDNPESFRAAIHASVSDAGLNVIADLAEGPSLWEKTPLKTLRPEQAVILATLYRHMKGTGTAFPESWVEVQRHAAHAAVDTMIEEYEMWAIENGRTDLTMSSAEAINAALPEGVEKLEI